MNKSEYIFGIRAIMEALEAGQEVNKVLLKKDLRGDLSHDLSDMLRTRGIPVQRVPMEKLNSITRKNHQGAIALLSPVAYYDLTQVIPALFDDGMTPFIMVLDGITDTRNFGAIARTAECAGVDAIVIPSRGSVAITADAEKASAGALMHLPVCRVGDIAEAVRFLRDSGLSVVAASEKASGDYTEADFTVPVAIVMGAEDIGISPKVMELCDNKVSIPILGSIGSLNVSVAAGVMAYEAVRQRRAASMDAEFGGVKRFS